MTDERAVSTTLGYVLTLSLATLVITGLLVGVGSFVEGQREQTAREELRVIGQQLATDIEAIDRLTPRVDDGGDDTDNDGDGHVDEDDEADTDPDVGNDVDDDGDGAVDEDDESARRSVDLARLSRDLPERVTGLQYTITLRNLPGSGDLRQLVLRPSGLDIAVRVNVHTATPFEDKLPSESDASQRITGGRLTVEGVDLDGDGEVDHLVVDDA